MNELADRMAKAAVEEHRVPLKQRIYIEKQKAKVQETAKWIGMVTYVANHWHEPPGRDSQASAKAAAATRCAREGRKRRQPKEAATIIRPPGLGGHTYMRCEGKWRCSTCRTMAGKLFPFASERCPGSAAQKWAAKALQLAEKGQAEGKGHARMLSGDILWCRNCGAYACGSAKGLAKPCPGKDLGSWAEGGGRKQQLHRLLAGKHPKHCHQLPYAIAEYRSCDARDHVSCQATKSTPATPMPKTPAQVKFEAMLARVRAKEASSGKSAAVKRRLSLKTRDPSWQGRQE